MPAPNTTLWNAGLFGGPASPTSGVGIPFFVRDLVYRAYRIAGVLPTAKRGYSGSQGADGLDILNSMIDLWKTERLMVYAIVRTVFSTVANQVSYSIGLSGVADVPIERPEKIEAASFVYSSASGLPETALRILTQQEWQAKSPKGMLSTLPTELHYQPTLVDGTLFPWPVVSAVVPIALYTWMTVNQFGSLDDQVIVPPGYRYAIEYNLGLQFALSFPTRQKMSQLSITEAQNSKEKIKQRNFPELQSSCELANLGIGHRGGSFNIYSNSYSR